MSAVLLQTYRNRIEIVTDAACLYQDGTIADLKSKVFISPHIPMAVAGRGDIAFIEGLADGLIKMSGCGSYDMVLKAFSEVFKPSGAHIPYCELVIAGYSDRFGLMSQLVLTAPMHGLSAFKLHNTYGQLYMGPITAVNPFSIMGLREHSITVMSAARAVKEPIFGVKNSEPASQIGGWLDFTEITKTDVKCQRIHQWNDLIGDPIS